jgi:hypothetical protein
MFREWFRLRRDNKIRLNGRKVSRWLTEPRRPRSARLVAEELEARLLPTLLGQQIFPLDYPWNQNISNAPVAANSAAIIANIGASTHVTPNWSADNPSYGASPLYGIPYNVVHGNSTAKVNVIIDNYPGESDLVPVPIPPNAVLEGDFQNGPNPNGAGYNPNQRGDSHLIVWDEDNNVAYELYGVSRPSDPTLFPNTANIELPHTDGLWHAAQESVWNMNTDSFRMLGETSADAAGLSILAGLSRPDEGLPGSEGGQGVINHALRVTLHGAVINRQYIYPASHMISTTQSADNLPLGGRLRLANTLAIDTLISNMPPESQIIATAMQQYGLVVADVGSAMYVSGASASVDSNNNNNLVWDLTDIFATNGLEALNVGDFQVVDLTPVITGLSATSGAPGSSITISGQNFSGAAGNLSVFFGSTPAGSVTVLSDTKISVVVPNGSGTVDVTLQSGINETDNISSNPNANVNAPIFGYGTSAMTPADQFTFTAAISGTVFNDLNGDGVQESGEPGLQGWTVQLLDSGLNIVGSAVTDANGDYTLTNVSPGTYTLQDVLQSGYVQTEPASPGTYPLTMTSGGNVTGANFGDFQLVTISGTVFNDLNDNHVQDIGEPGIPNVVVHLSDGQSAVTDANGKYSISGVGPGAFTLSEVIPAKYMETLPAADAYGITTSSGTNVTNQTFADAVPALAQGAHFGFSGYFETGKNWYSINQGWSNGQSRAHDVSSVAATANWTLTDRCGLPAGKYEIFVTYVNAPGRAVSASYTVQDGNTKLATVTVDQTAAPSGGIYQAFNWVSLGTYPIKTGRVVVTLSDNAAGSVDADGMLLLSAGPAQGPIALAAIRLPVLPQPLPTITMADGKLMAPQMFASLSFAPAPPELQHRLPEASPVDFSTAVQSIKTYADGRNRRLHNQKSIDRVFAQGFGVDDGIE